MTPEDKEYSDFLNIFFRVFTKEETENIVNDTQCAIRNEEAKEHGPA